MTVEAKDFDLRQMLAQTLMLWRGVADAKGLKLRIEGASAMPRHVKGDVMRIRQVLNNLMSNAMKFTEQGQITLRVQAWPEEPSGYALLFEIVDTGPRPNPVAHRYDRRSVVKLTTMAPPRLSGCLRGDNASSRMESD